MCSFQAQIPTDDGDGQCITVVYESLAKALICLGQQPKKPEDPMQFIRDCLAHQAGQESYKNLKELIEVQEWKIDTLQQMVKGLKETVAVLEHQIEMVANMTVADQSADNKIE